MSDRARMSVAGGLRIRMALGASLLVAAVVIAGAALFATVAERELTRQFESTMGSLATNLARNAAHGVFIESGDVLHELAQHLMEEPDVRRVVILNARDKEILADGDAKASGTNPMLGEVVRPVLYDASQLPPEFDSVVAPRSAAAAPKHIGTVRVVYSRARLEDALGRVKIRVWLTALVAALFGSAIAWWLAGRIIRPLQTLSNATTAVAAGDFETKVSETGGDEIAALARSFNRMIDALKLSREKLEETYAELARKDRLATLGQFTAVIAHELRNPLGVILASAQVISNPRRTAEMKERAAEFIVEEVRRLNADLTSFLNFARPKPPEIRAMSLADVARRAVDAWRGAPGSSAALEKTPTPIDHHPDAPTPGGVMARVVDEGAPLAAIDPDQVHQLLLNLLFNAAQALSANSGHGRDEGHITVRIRTVDGKAAMIVEDDGPGIPEDVKSHIFEPFFTTRKRGSGLGLAVVDQITRAHGGEVRLDSEPGKGTRFTILFPAAAALPASARTASRSRVP